MPQMDSNNPKESLVDRLNRKTQRTLDIETSLTPDNLAKCNPQLQSPLFTKLPPELRDIIWRFASTPDEDLSNPYPETAYYYRPGYRAPHRTSTSHLSTCRLAWLESNAFLMQQSEHPFWLLRGPYDEQQSRRRRTSWQSMMQIEYNRYRDFRQSFTQNNSHQFSTLHLFVQMFELERLAAGTGIFQHPLPGPKTLHITIRQSDWWDWERNVPLRMDEKSIQMILEAPRFAYIDVFRLELEALESQRDELDEIVAGLEKFVPAAKQIDHHGEQKTSHFVYTGEPKRWNWTRSPRLDDKTWPCFEGLQELRLQVVELTWHNTLTRTTGEPPEPPPAQRTFHIGRLQPAPNPPYWEAHHTLRETLRMGPYPWRRGGHRLRGWREDPTPLAERVARTWYESVQEALWTHDDERSRFEVLMGHFETRRLKKEWREKGPLLKFVQDD